MGEVSPPFDIFKNRIPEYCTTKVKSFTGSNREFFSHSQKLIPAKFTKILGLTRVYTRKFSYRFYVENTTHASIVG